MAKYEGPYTDPILQKFLQYPVSSWPPARPKTSGSDPVRQQILQSFTSAIISLTDMHPFVPIETLRNLFDRDTVALALAEAGCDGVDTGTCSYIANDLPRVFATLLLIGNVQAILEFKIQGLNDDLIPLIRDYKLPKERELAGWAEWYRPIHSFSDDELIYEQPLRRCFSVDSLWTLDKFQRFYDAQWLFSAPIFHPGKFEYALAPEIPLPFTRVTPYHLNVGGGSPRGLYMARIHSAHLFPRTTVRSHLDPSCTQKCC